METDNCQAKGVCVAIPDTSCANMRRVCGCNGAETWTTGCGFPTGYISVPYACKGCSGCVPDSGM